VSQSRKHSHLETITNMVVGAALGWSIVYFLFPFMGLEPNAQQATMSTVVFFFASYARSYVIRRIFNKKVTVK